MSNRDSIKFGVEIDTKGANSALDSLRQKLQAAGNVKLSAKGGLQDLSKGLQSLKARANEFSAALKNAAGPRLQAFTRAMNTAFLAVAAAAAAAGAAVAAGLAGAVKKGVEGNSGLESLHTGVAATVSSLYDLRDASGAPLQGLKRFEAAAAMAQERLAQLRKETAETGYTLEDRGAALNTGLGLGAAAGLDADAVQQFVRDITLASTAVGVAGEGLVNEVKALFAGQGLEESRLAQALAIDANTLQSWRVQGTLVQELNKRLADVKSTALGADQGMGQLTGRLQANVSNALAGATTGAYETIKASLSSALTKLFDENGEVAERYKTLYDWSIRLFDGMARGISGAIEGAIGALGGLADWVKANGPTIKGIGSSFSGMATSISGIAAPLKDLGTSMTGASSLADGLRIAFEMAERAVAALADVAKVAFGSVQLGVAAILKGLSELGKLGGKIPGLEGLGASAERLGESAESMGQAGAAMVASGLKLERSTQTAAGIAKRERERINGVLKSMQVQAPAADAPKAPQAPQNVSARTEASTALKSQAEAAAKAVVDAHAKAQTLMTSAVEAAERQRAASIRAVQEAELDRAAQLGIKSRKEVIDARLKLEKDALETERKQTLAAQATLQAALKDAVGDEAKAQLQAQLVAIDTQLKQLTDKKRIVEIKAELDTAAVEAEIAAMKGQLEEELRGLKGLGPDLGKKRDSSLSNPLVNGNEDLRRLVEDIYREETTQRDFEQQIARIAQIRQEQADAEAAIEEQYAASQITSLEREERLAQVRGDGVAKLREASTAMGELAAVSGNADLTTQVEELNKELDATGQKISEVNKRIVDELKSDFEGVFRDVTRGTKTFAEGMMDLLSSLLGRIADNFAKRGIESLFAGAGGAGAQGGWLGMFMSLMGGVQKKATGGLVSGPGTGTSDSIPTLLSNGEYVVRAAVTRKHLSMLSYLNQTGNLPQMRSAGGMVGSLPQGMGSPVQNTVNVAPRVVIQTGQLIEALQGDSAFERALVQVVSANKARLGIAK